MTDLKCPSMGVESPEFENSVQKHKTGSGEESGREDSSGESDFKDTAEAFDLPENVGPAGGFEPQNIESQREHVTSEDESDGQNSVGVDGATSVKTDESRQAATGGSASTIETVQADIETVGPEEMALGGDIVAAEEKGHEPVADKQTPTSDGAAPECDEHEQSLVDEVGKHAHSPDISGVQQTCDFGGNAIDTEVAAPDKESMEIHGHASRSDQQASMPEQDPPQGNQGPPKQMLSSDRLAQEAREHAGQDGLATGLETGLADSRSGSDDLSRQIDKEPRPADEPLNTHSPPPRLPPRPLFATIIDPAAETGVRPPSLEASLLEARQLQLSLTFDSKDATQQHAISTGVESVRRTYRGIRSTLGCLPEELAGTGIDWQLWDRVVEDYHNTVIHEQQHLAEAVTAGIPSEVRGIVWQLVARLKSLPLEELFMHLKMAPSIHEKAIKRDLTRTSFYTHVDAAHKAAELYDVVAAYANFDPDVGYTQGMVFIAVPLVMNMTASECFCLLVTLMKDYGLRDLFCPEMRGLHLLLHQFDRLLEVHLPFLYNHLYRQGVRLSMYASQWFLTFFSYKFPLEAVLRIFDMVITQGVEAVLRLALNLMLKNESTLLTLNFDQLLEFLKDSLFKVYVSDDFAEKEALNRRFLLLGRKSSQKGAEYYKLDAFILDSMRFTVTPLDLARWRAEFDQLCSQDSKRTLEIEALRAENGHLRHEIKQLETGTYVLNHDHLEAVQSLVEMKVALPELQENLSELGNEVNLLETQIHELEAKLGADDTNIPHDIETQIQELLAQNAKETERFTTLEEQLDELCLQDEALKAELKKNKKWFWKP